MSFDLKIENGDISFTKDGRLKTVNGNEKLKQDIIKILLTGLKENKYHPEYGADLSSIKIGYVVDAEMLELDLSASVETAIRNLMKLQRSQSKRQYLDPGEVIAELTNVEVLRDSNDPRLYSIKISILTQKLTNITENVTVRI